MPVLALNGDKHTGGQLYIQQMFRPLATRVEGGLIANSSHWTPEEQPDALANRMAAFFRTPK